MIYEFLKNVVSERRTCIDTIAIIINHEYDFNHVFVHFFAIHLLSSNEIIGL